MKDITLMILAAGMSSRFGGLKQVTPMGPSGEFIIDYSIYDAIEAGFTKVVFLIKREHYELFKETIGNRVESHIKVEYCFQENNNLPEGCSVPESRVKPLGTAHAMLCCKDKIHEPFAIINSDDFYGRDAFMKAAEFLRNMRKTKKQKYGLIGYKIKNTIKAHGSLKRGVCKVDGTNLLAIIESKVEQKNGVIAANPLNGSASFTVKPDTTVSMNMLLFNPTIFDYIEDHFKAFFDNNKDNLDTAEYLIPDVLFEAIDTGYATTEVIKTDSTWYGVTYKEDTDYVKESLKKLVDDGIYKKDLWN